MSSDDLRTRIAAAIMQTCHGVYLDDAVEAADAVIRELGLRIQVAGPAGIVGTGNYRYVTEWENDD